MDTLLFALKKLWLRCIAHICTYVNTNQVGIHMVHAEEPAGAE